MTDTPTFLQSKALELEQQRAELVLAVERLESERLNLQSKLSRVELLIAAARGWASEASREATVEPEAVAGKQLKLGAKKTGRQLAEGFWDVHTGEFTVADLFDAMHAQDPAIKRGAVLNIVSTASKTGVLVRSRMGVYRRAPRLSVAESGTVVGRMLEHQRSAVEA